MGTTMLFPDHEIMGNDTDLLISFVEAYEKHILCILGFLRIENYEMPTLPPDLSEVLGDEGREEIAAEFQGVRNAIRNATPEKLRNHGLLGRQLRFKLAYLRSREELLYDEHGNFSFNSRVSVSIGGIGGTIFDSVMDATGVGTGAKEVGSIVGDAVGDLADDALGDE